MSANIRIESGISAGTNYWIDRPVLRLGSDPQCDICLPSTDLAAHALTIEFRDGGYRFYNRSSSPVFVGGTGVQPGALGVWNESDIVQLPGDLRLALVFDGDPRPCPKPIEKESEFREVQIDTETSEDIAEKKPSKSLVQLAIIGFCVAGGALFLTMDTEAETAAPDRPTFESLVADSFDGNDAIRARIERLQFAEAAIVRGNFETAKARYSKLRDQLLKSNDILPEEVRENGKRILEFVEFRLSQL